MRVFPFHVELGRAGVLLLTLVLACGDSPTGTDARNPCSTATACSDRLAVTADRFVEYYRTHDPALGDLDAERAVILVHGAGRNARYTFETGLIAAALADAVATTVVVAPLFQTVADDPDADEPFWTDGGWKRGHLSSTDGPDPRVSSYAVLDTLVRRYSDPTLFPSMQEIVVAGHSAGGQVTHRYAAGGAGARHGLPVRYVAANPSTWLFLGDERPAPGGGFAVPDRAACPDYDEWHYGLADLNSYMSRLDEGVAAANLVARDVTVLLGDQDTGSLQLDVSCGAMLQGEHRYARGLNLLAYMDALFPGHGHERVIVGGVAHSSRGMLTSGEGLEALFGGE